MAVELDGSATTAFTGGGNGVSEREKEGRGGE